MSGNLTTLLHQVYNHIVSVVLLAHFNYHKGLRRHSLGRGASFLSRLNHFSQHIYIHCSPSSLVSEQRAAASAILGLLWIMLLRNKQQPQQQTTKIVFYSFFPILFGYKDFCKLVKVSVSSCDLGCYFFFFPLFPLDRQKAGWRSMFLNFKILSSFLYSSGYNLCWFNIHFVVLYWNLVKLRILSINTVCTFYWGSSCFLLKW